MWWADFLPTLTLCALLSGCSRIGNEVLGTVLSVQGEVLYLAEGEKELRPLQADSKLTTGTILQTAQGALLNGALLPRMLLQVSGDSEIKIEELKLTKDGNDTSEEMLSRKVRFRLKRGTINVLFQCWNENISQLTVVTQTATIRAERDCLFQIQTSDSNTRLVCARGTVHASADGGAIATIDEGSFKEWPSGRAGTISAVGDSRGQAELSETLEAERLLGELESQRENATHYVGHLDGLKR
jgi:hypothetical protein